MIVRILGEGQLEVPDSDAEELNSLDAKVEVAVEQDDEAAFDAALADLLAKVRQVGKPAQPDAIRPSELIVPAEGATMAEVRRLLSGEGLIPG